MGGGLRGRSSRAAAAAVLGVGALLVWPAGRAAAAGQVVGAGQVVELPSLDDTATRTPVDGRLRIADANLTVTAVGFDSTAEGGALTPAAGDQLVVVGLRLDSYPGLSVDAYTPVVSVRSGTSTPVTIPVNVAGNLATGLLGYWAVAVPAGAPAELDVADGPTKAGFDLRAGRRTASQVALYRSTDPTRATVASAALPVTDVTGTGSAHDPVTLAIQPAARVGYWPPVDCGGGKALDIPDPANGWLVVDLGSSSTGTITDAAGDTYTSAAGASPAAVTATLPDGTTVPLTDEGITSPEPPRVAGSCYAAEVPGDLTAATVQVTFAPEPLVDDTTFTAATTSTVTFAPATFHLAFPAVPATVTGYASGHPATVAPAASPAVSPAASHRPSSSSGSTIVGVVIAVVALASVAAGIVLLRRRSATLHPRPVTRPSRALLAGTPVPPLAAGWSAPGLPAPALALTAATASDSTEQPARGPVAAEPVGVKLAVRVLGPLEVDGLTAMITRRPVRRLLVLLALADRPLTVADLRDQLPDNPYQPPGESTVHSTASRLRAALPDGTLPPVGAGSDGYRLDPDLVDVDWATFTALTRRAATSDGPDRLVMLLAALGLVRGPVLAGSTWQGVDDTVRHLEHTVETTAVDAARLALDLRNARAAEAAVAAGLRALPGHPSLWELHLIAAAAGSGVGLTNAWARAQARLGPDAGTIAPTYQRLAAGAF